MTSYEQLAETVSVHPRECDCPEWTIRCAHWSGKCLVLTDLALAAAGHRCQRKYYAGQFGWFDMSLLEGEYTPCPTCGVDGFMFDSRFTNEVRGMATEADALAAFYAAEAELLGRAE